MCPPIAELTEKLVVLLSATVTEMPEPIRSPAGASFTAGAPEQLALVKRSIVEAGSTLATLALTFGLLSFAGLAGVVPTSTGADTPSQRA